MNVSNKYLFPLASGFILSGLYLLYKASFEYFNSKETEKDI